MRPGTPGTDPKPTEKFEPGPDLREHFFDVYQTSGRASPWQELAQ